MADLNAEGGVDLGHGDTIFGKVEERVVTEACSAARSEQEDTVEPPLSRVHYLPIESQGESAAIACLPAIFGSLAKREKERGVVAFVEGGTDRGVEVLILRVACAADAGSAVQSSRFEARVIGEDELAGSVARVIDRLEAGIGPEGRFVLRRRRDVFEAGERLDRESASVSLSSVSEVAEFPWIGSGGV